MNTQTATINLLLLDDHVMFRQGLARVLEKEPGMRVVEQCSSSALALAGLLVSGVTIVLLDVDLGAERALDFVVAAKKKAGENVSGNLDSFSTFVRKKTEEIRKQYGCQDVEFSVELNGGQVKLKAKAKS